MSASVSAVPAARAIAIPTQSPGSTGSSAPAMMPHATVPQVMESGSKYVLASTSAPAIINAPSAVLAMAMGHGRYAVETRAIAQDPARRRTKFGQRSSSGAITLSVSLWIITFGLAARAAQQVEPQYRR